MQKQSPGLNGYRLMTECATKCWTLFLVLCMLAVPGIGSADEDDVYESMYGSAASLYSTSYGIAFDALKEGQRLEPYIDKINKIAGFAATVGSATRKAASGDMYGAGEESALAIMAEVAGWEASGQAYLKYLGLSTGTFQLALTAYSITKESYAQVESTRIARDIESLYGAIESDPVLKPRTGRQLGDKSDPIPVTKQSVEYVFRKVVFDTSWRQRLKAYVSEELGKDFPEPSAWDKLSAIAVDGGRGYDTAGQAEVVKNRQEIETWIAGLLKRLNDYARAAESEVILRKTLAEIERASKKLTPEFVNYTVSVEEAVKRLPEIDAYAKQVPQAIATAKKGKRWDDLYAIRDRIGYFVRVYVRILPDTGDIGRKKQATKAALKQSWNDVATALRDIPRTLEVEFAATTTQYPSALAFKSTPINLIGIDEVDLQIRQAKTLQDAEIRAKDLTQDAAKKWQAFLEQFGKDNPPGDEHPQYKSRLESLSETSKTGDNCAGAWEAYKQTLATKTSDQARAGALQAYETCVRGYWAKEGELGAQKQKQIQDLIKEKGNYNQKREAYVKSAEQQYNALVKAIGKLTDEKRAQYADMEKLKKDALDKLAAVSQMVPGSYPDYPVYPPPMSYDKTPAGVRQLLNGLRSMKTDGYLGLPKMKFPKWGENGQAVADYIEGIKRKIVNESSSNYQLNENLKYAMEYIERLKKHLADRERYAQELAGVKERISALNLQSDPKAQALTDIEKRINDMKDVERLALEAETALKDKAVAESQKQLASIQDDLLYLDSLLKKVQYWRDAIQMYSTPLYKFGGSVNAVMVQIAMATEGSSGSNRRIFLAPSSSSTDLFDRAKANAAADALLKDVALTGIAKWDPSDDTGLQAMLEKKAAEIRSYYIDTPDYAIVDGNVVYAARIAKMAADVNAIPVSSYGSMTYKEGIRNRTFDEKLGTALRNGTAFAMNIEMKTNSSDQTIAVTLDMTKNLAAGHKNAAIKTASADLVKAVEEHLTRYNAQMAQEAKQFAIDHAKAEEELKLQNECLAKGGVYTNGKCTTMQTGPGQAGRPGQPTVGAGTPPTGTGPMTAQAGTSTSPTAPPQGQPGQAPAAGQPGVSPATPPAAAKTGGQPAVATQTAATQTSSQPAGQPQAAPPAAPPSGAPQAAPPQSPSQSGASGKPQTPPAGTPVAGQPGQSAPPAGPSQGAVQAASLPAAGKTATAAGTVSPQPSSPPQGTSPQAASQAKTQPPAASSGAPSQGSITQQPKTGAAAPMPSQSASVQQPKTGTGSMPQQSGMGPVASVQGAGSSAPKAVDMTPKVRDLYNQLKQAYESKSTSGVARCLSSQWGSSDGGSISDLQRNLQKIFTMFDEVRFNIQNMQINKVNETKYKVSYDVTITSKIYKKNLKHEEKSNINEEVTIDQSGQPKISRTLGGKLLSVK